MVPPKRMKLRKSSKEGGGGVIFNPKIYVEDFRPLNRAFSAWKCHFQIQKGLFRVCFQPITMLNCCTTCISWEIWSIDHIIHNSPAIMNIRTFVAKSATWFSENEGGGCQRPIGIFPKIHPFLKDHPSRMTIIVHCISADKWIFSPPSFQHKTLSLIHDQAQLVHLIWSHLVVAEEEVVVPTKPQLMF